MAENKPFYNCPYCSKRKIETVATIPFVRGMIIVAKYGDKQFAGCVGCVRTRILSEAGVSLLIGWFSPTALVMNPIFVIYGLGRGVFLGKDRKGVTRLLVEKGFPTGESNDVAQACYTLGVLMLSPDFDVVQAPPLLPLSPLSGKKSPHFYPSPEQMAAVRRVGQRVVPLFDGNEFEERAMGLSKIGSPRLVVQAMRRFMGIQDRQIVQSFLSELKSELNLQKSSVDDVVSELSA
ncbi:MAG: hypothetical protein ABUS57_12570 [Pseudomonadota bacterium]